MKIYIYIYVNIYHFIPQQCTKSCLVSQNQTRKDNQARWGLKRPKNPERAEESKAIMKRKGRHLMVSALSLIS